MRYYLGLLYDFDVAIEVLDGLHLDGIQGYLGRGFHHHGHLVLDYLELRRFAMLGGLLEASL